jgi:alanine racemase
MRAARAEINLKALARNLERVTLLAPNSKVLAIVKADAYGHGLEAVVQTLNGSSRPADAFGVASLDDAVRIRQLGVQRKIVVLSGFDEEADFELIQQYQLDCVIHDASQIDLLEKISVPERLSLRVWLKIDTGMRRLGFLPTAAKGAMERLRKLNCVAPEITLMSHFSQADEIGLTQSINTQARDRSLEQIEFFEHCCSSLPNEKSGGMEFSLSNSGATVSLPSAHKSWVRPGGLLYGLSTHTHLIGRELGVEPVMRLRTRLIATKQVNQGDFVGYGNGFQAPHDMRIGIAAIGYGDGYPRHAPSGTPVLVDHQPTKTVGRVSMDLLALDLTHLPQVKAGADVILWGPELPIETIARAAGTISYELSCGITRRVQFQYAPDL